MSRKRNKLVIYKEVYGAALVMVSNAALCCMEGDWDEKGKMVVSISDDYASDIRLSKQAGGRCHG